MVDQLEYDLSLYPAPVLRRPAAPVEAFDETLRATVEAMLRRMYASQGVGLAAPQVGLKLRLLVVNPTGDPKDTENELVLVNPRIASLDGDETLYEEGCLSFPGIYAEVRRPSICHVTAQDIAGKPFEAAYDGFLARIVQHEVDHLEGVLLVDRMSPADKQRNKKVLEELVSDFKLAQAASARTS